MFTHFLFIAFGKDSWMLEKIAKKRPERGDVSITKIQTGLSRPSQHPCRQECKQDAAGTDKAAGTQPP